MQSSASDPVEEPPLFNIPDDVAALYLWANLPDATYRDFSASRRKLRAQRGHSIEQTTPSSDPAEASPDPSLVASIEAPPPQDLEAEFKPEPGIEPPLAEPLPANLPSEPPQSDRQQTTIFSAVPHLLSEPQPEYLSPIDSVSYPTSSQPKRAPESDIQHHPSIAQPPPPDRSPEPFHSRWPALGAPPRSIRSQLPAPPPNITPILAVFAPTAGAGKTVLVATLGRALSSLGESVALAETSLGSPLSAHFATESIPPGAVRVVSPASGRPITLVTCDVDAAVGNPARQTLLAENFLSLGAEVDRLLLDLTERAGWFLHHFVRPNLTVLIPVTPTMGSVISLLSVERFFRELAGSEENPMEPYYLVVQFDEALPVHRDVRDFLARRVGDRLLPFVIRSASGVSQAFAQGMTVIDYAPTSPIAADYMAVAEWLRTLSPPAPPQPAPPPRHTSRWTDS